MLFFKNIIIGTLIGAGAIIPGVSSGVICVILGIYEKLLNAVLSIRKNLKESFKIIVPVGIGAIIGVISFGNVIKYLLCKYPMQVSFIFMGLVVGSIPELVKQTNKNEQLRLQNLGFLIISALIGIGMVILESNLKIQTNEQFSIIYLFMAGIFMSAGVVIPGVSSTVILMILGVYSTYLSSVANVYLPVLVPIISGLILGSILCMKLIKFLLDNYYAQTFYCIIGFTIGSVFVLYQGITFDLKGAISILCFILGATISKELGKL